ncbi:Electron transfer flavoprotein alpha/beta- subunit [Catenulispora acidiphila DSM 44928]|uniref:Electron transfer flavoprotein alpha/beta-subunit n=1 Tax=Catenulispora acidiphila (strain DSM 44928 / JCM 14897 / NBRC 102108 / NRRL B-24433 / ID139908) TaxID=479433 RepID=C7PVZ8_CATAD|nr:electron transfer flavoprotein subunit beta/FixA family protein [Catenulispora acidiphila]ACU71390.1 Electron transfer flavoprotein alpha/beta- subunit [Catenulispora acidiphila DSM 44928]
MKIVVLTKHVPQAIAEVSFAQDLTVDRSAVRCRLQDADEYAVEQAARIACRRLDVQVTAVTMGPSGASAALRAALARGADEGVHVLDDALHGSDAPATSLVLAAVCRRLGFDLVLCGSASTDSAMSVIPAMLAERLGVPALCCCDSLRTEEDMLHATRDDGAATEELAAAMPAVVSVTDRSGEPRYPRFEAISDARQKLVRTWSLADLGIETADVGLAATATKVGRVIRTEAGSTAVAEDPASAATRIADFLTRRQFL